jgi:hypothetical protein
LGEQFQRNRSAFALAAGELVHPSVGVLGQVEFLQHLRDDLGAFLFAGVRRQPQLGGVTQCLVHRQLAMHHIVLRHHADPAAHRRVLGVDVVAFEGDRTGAGAGVSGDQPRERGLARTGSPDDRGQRARPGRQGNVVQQLLAVDLELNPVDFQAAGAGRGFGAADQVAAGEDQVDVADGDHVALVEHRRADAHAIDERAVDAAGVPDLGAEWRLNQKRVMTRSQHVLNHDVVVVGATDGGRSGRLVRCEGSGQDRLDHFCCKVAYFGRFANRRRHLGFRLEVRRRRQRRGTGSDHRGRRLPVRRRWQVRRVCRISRRPLSGTALIAPLRWRRRSAGIRSRWSWPRRAKPGRRA